MKTYNSAQPLVHKCNACQVSGNSSMMERLTGGAYWPVREYPPSTIVHRTPYYTF